jgi:hypothetical protein
MGLPYLRDVASSRELPCFGSIGPEGRARSLEADDKRGAELTAGVTLGQIGIITPLHPRTTAPAARPRGQQMKKKKEEHNQVVLPCAKRMTAHRHQTTDATAGGQGSSAGLEFP